MHALIGARTFHPHTCAAEMATAATWTGIKILFSRYVSPPRERYSFRRVWRLLNIGQFRGDGRKIHSCAGLKVLWHDPSFVGGGCLLGHSDRYAIHRTDLRALTSGAVLTACFRLARNFWKCQRFAGY